MLKVQIPLAVSKAKPKKTLRRNKSEGILFLAAFGTEHSAGAVCQAFKSSYLLSPWPPVYVRTVAKSTFALGVGILWITILFLCHFTSMQEKFLH